MTRRIQELLRRLVRVAGKVGRALAWVVMGTVTRSPRPRQIDQNADGVVWSTTGSAVIEPTWGFVIEEPWRLHGASFEAFKIPRWLYASPSPIEWSRVRKQHPERIVELGQVISLRHFFEWNYYHFLIDVIPKLAMLERAGVDLHVPIVVGPSAVELPFAAQLRGLGKLAELDWCVQDRETYVRAEGVHLTRLNIPRKCRALTHRERARYTLEMIDTASITADLPPADRKVFLARRAPYGRLIANPDEVEAALSARGYEVIDAAGMNAVEQIRLFHQTRHLVAIHGAGMANMIFRAGQPMSVIELCPDVWNHVDSMRVMAAELGYDVTVASFRSTSAEDPIRANLLVDVDELLRVVDESEARATAAGQQGAQTPA
jgi:capsular polysaccharide biosynthesis protein